MAPKYKIATLIENESFAGESENIEDFCIETCIAALMATKLPEYFETMEVTLSLSDDAMIQDLNKRFMEKDKPTNVLSFPNNDLNVNNYRNFPKGEIMLGDIMLAYETIKKEAEEAGKDFLSHLRHLLIHGVLHLVGYDHESEEDAKEMERLEIEILAEYGIDNPYLV